MRMRSTRGIRLLLSAGVIAATGAAMTADGQGERSADGDRGPSRRAKNVIFFVGDGMGVSTITATRVYSVGVAGELVVDQFPYTALSRPGGRTTATS
jgi:alkaline phosphatase